MPRISTITKEDVLSLVKHLKQKRSAYVRPFLSMMEKVHINIYDSGKISNSASEENENTYRVKLFREDMNTQITFRCRRDIGRNDDSIPSLKDILANISRYGDVPENFDEFCKVIDSWYPGFPANEDDHKTFVRGSRRFKKIFSEKEIRTISKISPPRIWMKVARREKDRLNELGGELDYYKKLISRYGFDSKTGELNTKLFPITREDKEMKGIISAVNKYNNAQHI